MRPGDADGTNVRDIIERASSTLEATLYASRTNVFRRRVHALPKLLSALFRTASRPFTHSDIPPDRLLDPGIVLMHRGLGTVVHHDTVVEPPSVIFHGTTFGNNWTEDDGVPHLLPFTIVGAGASVLGGVTIGPCSFVGAGAVVTRDVPPLSIAVGNPAQIRPWRRQDVSRCFSMSASEVDIVLEAFSRPLA